MAGWFMAHDPPHPYEGLNSPPLKDPCRRWPDSTRLEVADVKRETEDAISIGLRSRRTCVRDFRFIHGQYLTLKLEVDGEELRWRSYSICSSPFEEGRLRTAREGPWRTGQLEARGAAQAGDTLEVMTPWATSHPLRCGPREALRGLRGGKRHHAHPGSILMTTLRSEPKSRFTLFCGNTDQDGSSSDRSWRS